MQTTIQAQAQQAVTFLQAVQNTMQNAQKSASFTNTLLQNASNGTYSREQSELVNNLLITLFASVANISTQAVISILQAIYTNAADLTDERELQLLIDRYTRRMSVHEQLKMQLCVNANASLNNCVTSQMYEVFGVEFTAVQDAVDDAIDSGAFYEETGCVTPIRLCNELFDKYGVDARCTGMDDLPFNNAYFITFNS